ncbi:MAG TPA: nitrate reductase [Verrucomicrobiae bacterium]|nr:nitrate reductase [Verrucomicrobiae bacterium]
MKNFPGTFLSPAKTGKKSFSKKISRASRPLRDDHGKSNSFLRQWHGPLTSELVLHPAQFGLGKIPRRLHPDAATTMVCGFCSTGCGLKIHLKNGEAINLSPDNRYPVNLGMACPKGWEALAPLSAPDRGTTPLVRDDDGKFQATTWDEAMKLFAGKFKDIMVRHGNESVAFLGTGQICTEEMALLGALWKFGMGAIHCDSNTRQCMATAHTAYKQSFGFDAPPFTYADFEESDVLIFIGANPCIAHPIMWQRVFRNKKNPQIIVVDPRRTETAMNATQHVALKPKSDLVLLYGIANLLIQNDWIDRTFVETSTRDFAEFEKFVRQFPLERIAAETELAADEILKLARTIHGGKAVSFWWTMGVNQSHEATRTAQAIINLALMTGNVGRPGTGANSITGQCNAMGSRLYANVTSLFGRDFLNPEHRNEIAKLLGIPPEKIPAQNSWAYDQIVEGIAAGKIKGLWVMATNTSHSWIDRDHFNRLAEKLEFLVVQDLYPGTETAQRAHLFLPAAGWGEKEGTLINSERRIGVVKKIRRAPGEALSDFNIFKLVAHYWGCSELFRDWSSSEAVFQILKKLSAGQPCDITGIRDYKHIDECGGIQWPFPATATSDPPGTERRLFADGKFFTADGKAKFIFDLPRPAAELTDEQFPFVLLTGRGTSAQWHTNTRTGKSDVLRKLYPANAYVEINSADASRLKIKSNERILVASRRATVECAAFVTGGVRAGQVFIPMHYGVTNRLTNPSFDPHSRQPSYKHCAVRLEKIA